MKVVNKPSTYGWHAVSGEDKTLREKQTLIDSGSESGMTQDCHPELDSGSIHLSRKGKTLTRICNSLRSNKFSPLPEVEGKKSAFTLAEVLITLAIIGVVATMTIPTLIANYQERSWNTSATVFDRKLTEALKIMNSQSSLAGHKTTENFVKELSKHLKIVRTCDNSNLTDCFVDSMTMREDTITVDLNNISTSADLGQSDWDTNIVGIQLANGTNALVAYNPNCKQDPYSNQITGGDCLAIMYDTTGFKSPNHLSKDLRANANVKKVASRSVCAFEVNGKCFTAPFYPDGVTKARCEEMVASGNYGEITSCSLDDDRWAGAVEKCGGTSKMPTMADLAALANYIYNTNQVAAYEVVMDLIRDPQKASGLGFANSIGSSSFYIWSNEEDTSEYAFYRAYLPTYTSYSDRFQPRNISLPQAVCIGD